MKTSYKPAVIKDKPFLNIRETCNLTGLSQRFLREGCKTGSIPHVMSGNVYMINIRLLYEAMDKESLLSVRDPVIRKKLNPASAVQAEAGKGALEMIAGHS